ncbi:MAG: SPOR domain-containing protein [Rhizobiales bacterium]|nr:SPOR domain-containing protein [Hyphomicrobiales bacterium]
MTINAKIKNIFRILFLGAFLSSFCVPVFADNFMSKARGFSLVPQATIEQNQEFIVELNQFTAEGNYSSEDLAEILLIRAIIFSKLKDIKNAEEGYSAAISSGQLSPILLAEALKNKGLLHYRQKEYLEATADFKSALEILSGNAELQYYLANSYFGILNFEDAIEQYQFALGGMANNRYLALYGLASVYFQQNELEKSEVYLHKSLKNNKDFQLAKDMLKRLGNPIDTIDETGEYNNSEILTANDIYSQILSKALAHKNKDSKKSFSINIDTDKKQAPSSTPKVKEKPLVNQFIAKLDNAPRRLNALLVDGPKKVINNAFYLQLASFRSQENTKIHYDKILKRHRLLLANRPFIIRKHVNSGITSYPLLIGAFQSYKQANSLCRLLKAQKSDCFVRQLK